MRSGRNRRLLVRNKDRQTTLAESAHIADTRAARLIGLLGSDRLKEGQGLWIVPCASIHTLGMKFLIDLVYLNRNCRVLKVKAGVTPWRISACLWAASVLELPGGTISRTGTRYGDQLDFIISR